MNKSFTTRRFCPLTRKIYLFFISRCLCGFWTQISGSSPGHTRSILGRFSAGLVDWEYDQLRQSERLSGPEQISPNVSRFPLDPQQNNSSFCSSAVHKHDKTNRQKTRGGRTQEPAARGQNLKIKLSQQNLKIKTRRQRLQNKDPGTSSQRTFKLTKAADQF